jgi:signal transduction histidine kinase
MSTTPIEASDYGFPSAAETDETDSRIALKWATAETERVNQLLRANKELLAGVIHDLHTPLLVMRMCATLLSRTLPAEQRAHMDRLVRATELVRNLVDTLVPACVGVSGSVAAPFLISSSRLLVDAADATRMLAEKAGIGLTVDPSPEKFILADHSQMLRVLANLIGNCIKHCPRGSSVILDARVSAESIFISVSDDGPGMTISDQIRAFERGWQGSESRDRHDGSGLGLSIVRALVEQNKGSVSLASQCGLGTRVTVRLPLCER